MPDHFVANEEVMSGRMFTRPGFHAQRRPQTVLTTKESQ